MSTPAGSRGDQLHLDFMETELACELYCDEVVDGSGRFMYIDKSVSVSAPTDDGRLARFIEKWYGIAVP